MTTPRSLHQSECENRSEGQTSGQTYQEWYDERMFEELYRRAQLFEVTLGGDMRVEGRIEAESVKGEKKQREKAGIGTEDEDLGTEVEDTGAVDLPKDMVERLRVDLSVWKQP